MSHPESKLSSKEIVRKMKKNFRRKEQKKREKYCNSNLRILFKNPEQLSFLWKAVLSGKNIESALSLLKFSKMDVTQRINYEDLDDPRLKSVSSNLLIVLARSTNKSRWSEECKLAEALVEKGIDVNDVELNSYYVTHNSALYYALKRGNDTLAEFLFSKGAVLNVLGYTNFLPMYAQYWIENPSKILPLLYKYASINGRNKIEFVRLLADYNVPQAGVMDKRGLIPLYDALFERDYCLV